MNPQNTQSSQPAPTPPSSRLALIRAAITGVASGATRALVTWFLTH